MRRRRLYRWVIVVVLVAGGLLAALDVAALQIAESRAAAEFARTTAAERASIDLGSFPFLPGLARGRVRKVEVEATNLSGGGLRVASLKARLSDMRFAAGEAIALLRSRHAGRIKVSGRQPFGSIEVLESDLQEFIREREPEIREVKVTPSGVDVRFLIGEELTQPARFLPRIEEQRLVLKLVGVAGLPTSIVEKARRIERTIDLPRIPEGLRPEVRLGSGVFVVEATGLTVELFVGEGGIRS